MLRQTVFLITLISACAGTNFAQLSPYQKNLDFQELVALFDKDYAFLEWKNQAFGFDGLNLAPWMASLNASQDDLSYFEAATLYASSFRDSHTIYYMPSTFYAALGFTVDVYSGKVLIDSIDPTVLDAKQFPLQVGDELASVDGRSAADWMTLFTPFINDASPVSRARTAAGYIVFRDQEVYPRATEIGDTAEVVINRPDGTTVTYQIPWQKTGVPYQSPLLPDPSLPVPSARSAPIDSQPLPYFEQLKRKMRNFTAKTRRFSLGVDDFTPFFGMPSGFKIHKGTGTFDSLYSGSFQAGGYTIAYIRIPDFQGSTPDVQSEINYFTSKVPTDGLILDLMRNPGGYGCDAEAMASALSPNPLVSVQIKERVTFADILNLQFAVVDASTFGTQADVDFYSNELSAYQAAYSQLRGFTDPLPLCNTTNQLTPATDTRGRSIAYTKPVMILTDEMTASSAEILASIMQDNHAALIYGSRSNGAGGAVDGFDTGSFTEGVVYMARGILVRSNPQTMAGLPSEPYIENFGVQPDIAAEYMTTDNLLNNGQTFVNGFVNAMVNYIQSVSAK